MFREPIIAQRYMPEVRKGDKRIILVDGKAAGAVNRVPAEGVIDVVAYHPGRFLSAADDKASEENERQSLAMTLPDGRRLAFVQIAGLVARRILCDLKPQQSVRAGERFGLIRFGSRADVYLPPGVQPLVAPGQRMVAGETVIADLTSNEAMRPGHEH